LTNEPLTKANGLFTVQCRLGVQVFYWTCRKCIVLFHTFLIIVVCGPYQVKPQCVSGEH